MKLSAKIGVSITLALGMAMLFGCSESAPAVRPGFVVTNAESVAWCDLPDSAPLVMIGNRTLTKGDLLNSVSNEYHALIARGEKIREVAKKFEQKKVELASQHVARFLHQAAFLQRADELGVVADESEVAAQWSALSNIAGKSSMDVAKFAMGSGHPSLAAMDTFIRDNIRMSKVFKQTFSNSLDVSQAEVDAMHAKLSEGNRRSASTNALYLAEFKKFRQELIDKKVTFSDDDEANAKKVREPFKVEWFAKAPANSFDDEDGVVGKVRYQQLNTWSEPLEDDETFSIYYMTEIEQKSSEAPTLFTGFRVFREKDHGFMLPDKKKLMNDMRKIRNVQVVTPEFERLCRHFGVLYPNGLIWRDIFSNKKSSKGAKK